MSAGPIIRRQEHSAYCPGGASRPPHSPEAIQDAGPPRYTLREHRLKPVLGPYTLLIDRWLKEDLAQPSKQRHTARRIYHRLVVGHGFTGGESTVREYVPERRPRLLDRFISLAHEPGQDTQADFGEAQ